MEEDERIKLEALFMASISIYGRHEAIARIVTFIKDDRETRELIRKQDELLK